MEISEAKIRSSLASLNLRLPHPPAPGRNYFPAILRGPHVSVSIQFPILNGDFFYQGKLGKEISTEMDYLALQLCAPNVLSQLHQAIGLNEDLELNHLQIYFQASEDWGESPRVADGASDLFVQGLGKAAQHTRSLIGVAALPKNFCVGLVDNFSIDHSPQKL